MKSPSTSPQLYAITDSLFLQGEKLFSGVDAALRGGCQWIQYRDKSNDSQKRYAEALKLLALCNHYNAKLIVNDDVELAQKINAHGVHLGQGDANPLNARRILGEEKIIGVTCHDSLELAQIAVAQSANYIAFGRFFPSLTKPDAKAAPIKIIQQAREKFSTTPIAVIGGITLANCLALVKEGADFIAVSNGLFNEPDIRAQAEKFNELLR